MLSFVCACGSNNNAVTDAAIDPAHDPGHDANRRRRDNRARRSRPTHRPRCRHHARWGTHYHYIIDHEYLPTSNQQALQYGLDLNNDADVDNQLGMVLATFNSMGFAVQPAVTISVDHGNTLLLADLQASDLVTASNTGFSTYFGQNPQPAACTSAADTVCRHHLTGTGTFDAAAMPRNPALPGAATAGTFTQGAGHLSVQVALFSPNPPMQLDLIGARVKLTTVTATSIGAGVIGGAVTTTDINTKLIPAIALSIVPVIAHDCTALSTPPGCGCTSGSTGQTLIALFDANHDCVVSATEIQNNNLIQSLLAPDLTIQGQTGLSFGMGITATHATFTP